MTYRCLVPAIPVIGPPLGAVRDLLDGADDVLLWVSYLRPAGVGLLAAQMGRVRRGRLLVATDRVTTADGIQAAERLRFAVRGHRPARGVHHAKVYVGMRNGVSEALVGSGNMTGGLAVNDEAMVRLSGPDSQTPIADLTKEIEARWRSGSIDPASQVPRSRIADFVNHDLWIPLAAELDRDPVIETATGARNVVVAHDRTGFRVSTDAAVRKGTSAQLVRPWMLEVVHARLLAEGWVTSVEAQGNIGDGGLNVKRSAFVLGLLARHPDVEWADRRRGSVAVRLRRRSDG